MNKKKKRFFLKIVNKCLIGVGLFLHFCDMVHTLEIALKGVLYQSGQILLLIGTWRNKWENTGC